MKTMLALILFACAACGGQSDDPSHSCGVWGYETTQPDGAPAQANVLLRDGPVPPAGCVAIDDAGHADCPLGALPKP